MFLHAIALLSIGLVLAQASTPVNAQAPVFGSPYQQQQVEIFNPATGTRRTVTLTKRADGDYEMQSVEAGTGRQSSGLLRNEGGGRFDGDVFDSSHASFRQVVVTEEGEGIFGIEELDYGSGSRTSGTIRCSEGSCSYKPRN